MGWEYLELVRAEIHAYKPTEVIHGNAAGADMLAMQVCREEAIPYRGFDPDWNTYGKSAGIIRNQAMVLQKPDQVLAFYKKNTPTRGTLDMIRRANEAGVPVRIVEYENQAD